MKSKKTKVIVISFIVLVVVAIVIFFIMNNIQKKKEEEERIKIEQMENEIKNTIALTSNKIVVNTSQATKFLNIYIDAYNKYSISMGEENVRNQLLEYSGTQELFNTMKENDNIIIENMGFLSKNKSTEYNEVYEVLLDMYDAYRYYYDKVTTLSVYSSNLAEVKEKGNLVLEKVNRIIVMKPELEEAINTGKIEE